MTIEMTLLIYPFSMPCLMFNSEFLRETRIHFITRSRMKQALNYTSSYTCCISH